MVSKIWTEEYRPKTYEEVVGLKPELMYKLEKNLPHLLFVGPAGIGKTTTMKIIAKRVGSDVLLLNSSDERKIETVRDKIKMFAMTKASTDEGVKIVFLDEFDGMLPLSQEALRNIMETYSSNCRFLLSANFESKIIDPIKSRCVKVSFEKSCEEDILKRLKFISSEEDLLISDDLLRSVIRKKRRDIRKCINTLQELKALGREITEDDIKKEELLVEELFELLKAKKFMEARRLLLNNNVDFEILTLEIYSWVYTSNLTSPQKIGVIKLLCEVSKYLNFVVSKELLFADFLIKCVGVLK